MLLHMEPPSVAITGSSVPRSHRLQGSCLCPGSEDQGGSSGMEGVAGAAEEVTGLAWEGMGKV